MKSKYYLGQKLSLYPKKLQTRAIVESRFREGDRMEAVIQKSVTFTEFKKTQKIEAHTELSATFPYVLRTPSL